MCRDCGGRVGWTHAERCRACRDLFVRSQPRFDLTPLIEKFGSQSAAARALDMDRALLGRMVRGGASERVADRLCSRVGWHLSQLPTFEKADA